MFEGGDKYGDFCVIPGGDDHLTADLARMICTRAGLIRPISKKNIIEIYL